MKESTILRLNTYVPNAVVKDVLVQTYPEGRRGKWIAALLEYDVEIKPTKLIAENPAAIVYIIFHGDHVTIIVQSSSQALSTTSNCYTLLSLRIAFSFTNLHFISSVFYHFISLKSMKND